MRRASVFSLAVLLAALPAGAQVRAEAKVEAGALAAQLSPKTRDGVTRNPDLFLERALRLVFEVAEDGTLSRGRVDRHLAQHAARLRARTIGDILALDLDGDLALGAEDVARTQRHGAPEEKRQLSGYLAQADADGDGALSTAEILAHAEAGASGGMPGGDLLRDLLVLDLNGDSVVTPGEIGAAVRALAGVGAVAEAAEDACRALRPSSAAHVVFVSGHEGEALSTLAVAGQDRVTTVATIEVEAGAGPVYIVADALSPVIWRVTGATDRVEAFLAGVYRSGTGVTGLAPEVVHLAPPKDCVPGYVAPHSADRPDPQATLADRLGQPATEVAGTYTLGTVRVPSGVQRRAEMPPPPATGIYRRGGAWYRAEAGGPVRLDREPLDHRVRKVAELRHDLDRLYPGGLVDLAPGDVLAAERAAPYEVLPHGAGLVQLIEARSLRVMQDGRVRIRARIPRFPPGLSGPFTTRFLLDADVPMPAGDPGSASVLDLGTGTCVVGDSCGPPPRLVIR